jgi:cholesterol transport system auxiliary component
MNSARGKAAAFLLAIVALFLGACGAARPSKYYQLTIPGDTPAGQAADPAPAPVTLLVGNLFASDLYREDRIVYSTAGEQMGTYEYERWAEPPTEMIQEVLLRELRSSGRYRAVFVHRSDATGDFLLRGRLYDFKEVSGNGMVARLKVDFEMRDVKNGAIVWTHYYQHDEPVSGKNVVAVVAALDKNVQLAIKEVLEGLDQYFAAHPPK